MGKKLAKQKYLLHMSW